MANTHTTTARRSAKLRHVPIDSATCRGARQRYGGMISFRLGQVDSDRNHSCAIVLSVVALDRNLSAIITPISIIGAGIRVGRGRVM